MSLRSNERGYATMSRDLSSISIEWDDIATCKKYCYGDDVVVERIPYVCGYELRLRIKPFYKLFSMKYGTNNILWFHFNIDKIYSHKCGKIVYDLKATENS